MESDWRYDAEDSLERRSENGIHGGESVGLRDLNVADRESKRRAGCFFGGGEAIGCAIENDLSGRAICRLQRCTI